MRDLNYSLVQSHRMRPSNQQGNPKMLEKKGKFGLVVILSQIVIVILYGITVRYDKSADASLSNATVTASSTEFATMYAMFQDIHVMIFIGFGFLMTFLKNYSFSAVALNLFLASFAIELHLVISGLFTIETKSWTIPIDLQSLVEGDFAAAAVLISFGAVLGKTSPLQLLLMVIIEVVAYSANGWITTTFIKAADVGGSMVIHVFGAYFGLSVALVLKRNDIDDSNKEKSVYHSDLFSMIGTVFLWIFWPSFNGALAVGDDRHRTVINTYLALVGACVTTFAVSNCVQPQHKFNMVHIQNATLAGGVAIGTAADTMVHPCGALLVGSVAGLLSTLGYRFIQKIHLHDTCGVNNLHGMPGLLAGVLGIIMLATASVETYGQSLYEQFPMLSAKQSGRSPKMQAAFQALALLSAFVIAVVTGLVTGFCMKMPCFEPLTTNELFDDESYFEIPDEEQTPMTILPSFQVKPKYPTKNPKSAPLMLPSHSNLVDTINN